MSDLNQAVSALVEKTKIKAHTSTSPKGKVFIVREHDDRRRKGLSLEQAVALYQSKWWQGQGAEEIVSRQLKEPRLIVPINIFKGAAARLLGRRVKTGELGSPVFTRQLRQVLRNQK